MASSPLHGNDPAKPGQDPRSAAPSRNSGYHPAFIEEMRSKGMELVNLEDGDALSTPPQQPTRNLVRKLTGPPIQRAVGQQSSGTDPAIMAPKPRLTKQQAAALTPRNLPSPKPKNSTKPSSSSAPSHNGMPSVAGHGKRDAASPPPGPQPQAKKPPMRVGGGAGFNGLPPGQQLPHLPKHMDPNARNANNRSLGIGRGGVRPNQTASPGRNSPMMNPGGGGVSDGGGMNMTPAMSHNMLNNQMGSGQGGGGGPISMPMHPINMNTPFFNQGYNMPPPMGYPSPMGIGGGPMQIPPQLFHNIVEAVLVRCHNDPMFKGWEERIVHLETHLRAMREAFAKKKKLATPSPAITITSGGGEAGQLPAASTTGGVGASGGADLASKKRADDASGGNDDAATTIANLKAEMEILQAENDRLLQAVTEAHHSRDTADNNNNNNDKIDPPFTFGQHEANIYGVSYPKGSSSRNRHPPGPRPGPTFRGAGTDNYGIIWALTNPANVPNELQRQLLALDVPVPPMMTPRVKAAFERVMGALRELESVRDQLVGVEADIREAEVEGGGVKRKGAVGGGDNEEGGENGKGSGQGNGKGKEKEKGGEDRDDDDRMEVEVIED